MHFGLWWMHAFYELLPNVLHSWSAIERVFWARVLTHTYTKCVTCKSWCLNNRPFACKLVGGLLQPCFLNVRGIQRNISNFSIDVCLSSFCSPVYVAGKPAIIGTSLTLVTCWPFFRGIGKICATVWFCLSGNLGTFVMVFSDLTFADWMSPSESEETIARHGRATAISSAEVVYSLAMNENLQWHANENIVAFILFNCA